MVEHTLDLISHEGRNVTFKLSMEGFVGIVRINYADKTRKNSRHKEVEALDIYYDGWPKNENVSSSFNVKNVTDAMIFCERYKQWILEKLVHGY